MPAAKFRDQIGFKFKCRNHICAGMVKFAGGDEPFEMSIDQVRYDEARISKEITNLVHSTDPFAEAVRATRMPMVITAPRQHDNPVVFVNDAFCRLSGSTRDEIIGQNCRFLQGPETDQMTRANIARAITAGAPIQTDIRNYRKMARHSGTGC